MRRIVKGAEPPALRDFKTVNRATPQALRYDSLGQQVRRELRERMLAEQGRLCAYTMSPIGRRGDDRGGDDFHVEHILPRSRHPERELDYDNMVLCCPGPDANFDEYGARRKGGAEIDDENFVSPLNASCEWRLRYGQNGRVRAATDADGAAKRTIELLALNHRNLVDMRIAALQAQGLAGKARRPLSAAKAERLALIIVEPSASGDIAPFCIAIKQVAERFAWQRRERAARLVRAPDR